MNNVKYALREKKDVRLSVEMGLLFSQRNVMMGIVTTKKGVQRTVWA